MKTEIKDTKKLFRTLGSCSRTYFHLVNREFGNSRELEERAADPLAGGIYRQGYQCGMLWGASLAAGTEAYRRIKNRDHAIAAAIKATQHIMGSFKKHAESIECYDLTDCDWSSKLSMAKYFISGKFRSCFNLAEEWAPYAVDAVIEGLALDDESNLPINAISCASEVACKMGASDEEMVMVAGFAGGLGLCGNACGALSATIWMKTLGWCRDNEKTLYKNPDAEETLEKFYVSTDYKITCRDITGEQFNSVDEHTNFIRGGGCEKLLESLAQI